MAREGRRWLGAGAATRVRATEHCARRNMSTRLIYSGSPAKLPDEALCWIDLLLVVLRSEETSHDQPSLSLRVPARVVCAYLEVHVVVDGVSNQEENSDRVDEGSALRTSERRGQPQARSKPDLQGDRLTEALGPSK